MKNLLFTICLVFVAFAATFAQDQTLFGSNKVTGGFGAPIFEYSTVDGDFGTATGGGGAVVLQNFFLGGFGMGGNFGNKTIDNVRYRTELGYGGLWLGYVYPTEKLIHLYSSVKLGWGGASLDPRDEERDQESISDAIFVVTPELGIELNVFNWFRIAGTAGYRVVGGLEGLPQLSNEDFSNFNFGLTLRFGKFTNRDKSGYDDDDDDEDDN